MPDRDLQDLLRALGDDGWRVRKEAVEALAVHGEPRAAAQALVEILENTDEVGLRNAAIETLTRIGKAALAPLARALDKSGRHRKFLLDTLGAIGDEGAAGVIDRFTADEDANVRVAAAEALGRVGGSTAERSLMALARDTDMLVQVTALDTLAGLGTRVPVRELELALRTPVVRCSALRLLGSSGAAEATAPLVQALTDRTRRAREAAMQALARLSADVPIERQLRQLSPEAIRNVTSSLDARDASVRTAAAALIGMGRHRDASARLAQGIDHPDTGPAFAHALRQMDQFGGRVTISDSEFRKLRDLIHEHCGIYFQDDAGYLIQRRLAPRLEATGCAGFGEYYRKLLLGAAGRQELAEAVERITTNETYFFRESYQLRSFQEEILRDLLISEPRGRSLSVWSAGCSTGEEPYTLAMLISELDFDDWRVAVTGTDISRRVLSVAQGAVYGQSSMRAIEADDLRRYFSPIGDKHAVRERIRDMVDFRPVNLLDHQQVDELGRFDAIFCRNVLMYFDRESRRRVIQSFFEHLVPGGYLLLGHSESLINLTTAFELVQLQHDMVYRRPER